jgi:hypothetical protein
MVEILRYSACKHEKLQLFGNIIRQMQRMEMSSQLHRA